MPEGLWTMLLVSIRLGALLALAPPLGQGLVPWQARTAILVALSAALSVNVEVGPTALQSGPLQPGALLSAVASEAALGAAMALGLQMALASVAIGARLLDVQFGFGMGQVLDPATRRQQPVLSALFTRCAILLFLLVDGHHAMLRGIFASLQALPPGAPWPIDTALPMALQQGARMFALGAAFALPVGGMLLLTEIVLGAIARSVPQINTFLIGMPVKILVGSMAIVAWSIAAAPMMHAPFAAAIAGWELLWR